MTDIEQIKREVGDKLSKSIPHSYSDNTMLNTIDYLHARGYLGGVPDARLELEYERGRRDALMNLVEATAPKGETK